MKYQIKKHALARHLPCLGLALAFSLALPLPALAASVTLATQPLATSTTSSVKPNLLLVLDNSGSMDWDHMPDDASDGGSAVTFQYGYYGLRSSQCNQVYYDPAIAYLVPLHPDGTSYANASFTGAWDNGYNTGAGTADLRTGFMASQSLAGDGSGQSAYYYSYSGAQATSLQKNYNSTSNTFYSECHSAQYAAPGKDVFTKVSLTSTAAATTATIVASCSSCSNTTVSSIKVNGTQEIMSGTTPTNTTTTGTVATEIRDKINLCTSAMVGNCTTVGGHGYTATVSGSTVTLTGLAATATSLIATQSGSMTLSRTIFPIADATKLQNFANWYSYYRTRMLMMKTATGRAFSSINKNYRVGLMKISSSSTPTVYVDTFWDNTDTSLGPVSTQRTTWYNALYNTTVSGSTPLRTALSDAGRYYAGKLSGTDPIQYSCQQNFALLSTDGYWNTGNGYKLDGSTAVGNQDGLLPRPFYDGSTLSTARSTSQIQMTQTQVRQSTSQVQKRTQQIQSSSSNLQSTTSNLRISTSQLQSQAWQLQYRTAPLQKATSTNSGSSWSAWSNVASCTWDTSGSSRTKCQYDTANWTAWTNGACTINVSTGTSGGTIWTNDQKACQYIASGGPAGVSSCTTVAKTTSTTNGTVWTAGANTCNTVTTGPTNTGSCTAAVASAGNNWTDTTCNTVITGPTNTGSCTVQAASAGNSWTATTSCAYTAYSGFANASSCTVVAQSGPPNYVGPAVDCQTTDTGWVGASSCAASSSGGQTVTCQTITTGPTLVSSCSAASANSGNAYTTTTCATTTIASATPVASCTAEAASSSNNYTTTTCNTVTTGPTVGSCTAVAASSSNNWTATTCTQAVTGGGTSDNLADIAAYYYQTDLRTPALLNCGTPAATGPLCENNVFMSGNDRNLQQHMTTFTLGLGASGWMNYSSSYLSDTTGDYVAVKNGSTTNLAPSTITVSGSGSTSVSSITANGVQLMSGTSTASTDINTVASNIAARITLNSFTATASGNVITITGPASAANYTPVITQSGAMVLTAAAGTPACSWQANGTACNWPFPGMSGSDGLIANVDDLWHAAVNGYGAYFSATNPTTLSAGLSGALAGINARKGSAAAAATSTLNPVAGNNAAFVASYTTVTWKGNLEARGINTVTGQVNENADWCVENVPAGNCPAPSSVVATTNGSTTTYSCVTPNAVICTGGTMNGTDCSVPVATSCTGTMGTIVSTSADTRTIKTANSTGTALIDFGSGTDPTANAAYAAANSGDFSAAHISTLSQWSLLTPAQQAAAEGASLVSYLRGQYQYEDRTTNADKLYRYREAVLGDALESQPAFIGQPVFSYPYTGYAAYKTAQTGRAGTVYMGANDGMMHAFATATGIERWAYVPSMVIPDMWILADKNYSTLHRNFVNGSPITSDIYCPGNCGGAVDVTFGDSASWRTILVAGLNGGGRGYFALDITDPVTPTLLWEFKPTASVGRPQDVDLGYSFGQSIITRKADGTWVVLVTSGYNNTSPGDGKGYLFVLNANTGAIISKIATGVGSTTTPSGLARIAAWNDEPAGNQAGYVYGGDLLGNVWRFNINSTVTAAIGTGDAFKFAVLYSEAAATNPQPITTTPTLGLINGKRVVFIGTGKYLEIGDLTTTRIQTQYAIKDADATVTLVNPRTTLVQQTLTNVGASRTVSSNSVNFYTDRGWYVDLPDSGERVNIDSKLVQGTLLVPSIVPSSTACSPGGYGWLNFFNFQTGGAVDATTSLAAVRYDATIVGINVIYVQGMPKVGVVTSTNPTPELNTGIPFSGSAAGFSGKRVIWRELIQ